MPSRRSRFVTRPSPADTLTGTDYTYWSILTALSAGCCAPSFTANAQTWAWVACASCRSQMRANAVQSIAKGLPKHTERPGHFAALPYADVPAFVAALHASDAGDIAQLAFEFLILNASRTGEILGAKWAEINTAKALWTIPADR